tara:strand:+ start:116 stop:223 length:108 start_codon:yes stop_codon:yes gene_type:complete
MKEGLAAISFYKDRILEVKVFLSLLFLNNENKRNN